MWPLDELDDFQKFQDLMEALTLGNLKGAYSQPDLLQSLFENDVTHGFCLVIPLFLVSLIPGALIAPMNVMEQNTIDKQATSFLKRDSRMTNHSHGVWAPPSTTEYSQINS